MGRTMHTPQRTLDDRFQTAAEGFLFLLIAALALPSGMTAYAAVAGGLGAMAGLRIDAFALFFLLLGLVTVGAAAFRSR